MKNSIKKISIVVSLMVIAAYLIGLPAYGYPLQTPTTSTNSSTGSGRGAVLADMDGDGDADLIESVMVFTTPYIVVDTSDGDGTFTNGTYFSADPGFNYQVSDVTAFDVDGDSDKDIVYGTVGSQKLCVSKNLGSLTFSTTCYLGVARPSAIAYGDIDGDSDKDVVSAMEQTSGVNIFFNNGSGNYSSQSYLDLSMTYPSDISLVDMDGDTDLDIVTSAYTGGKIYVSMNDGSGSFSGGGNYSVTGGPYSIAVADYDNDSDADVVAMLASTGGLARCNNNGSGALTCAALDSSGDFFGGLITGDINSDGYSDVLGNNVTDDTLYIYLGTNGGAFAAPTTKTISAATNLANVALGDVNGNGYPDAVSIDSSNANFYVMLDSVLSNDLNVNATIDPTLTFAIRSSDDSTTTSTCSMGSIVPASVSTCAYRLAIETNATNGFTAKIQADGGFLSGSNQIDDIAEDGTVSAGTEGYGIQVTGATGLTEAGNFNDDDTPVPTAATTIMSSTIPYDYTQSTLTTSTLITHATAVSPVTPAGTYGQVVTYTVTASF